MAPFDYDDAILGVSPDSVLKPLNFRGGDGQTFRLTINPTNADDYLQGEAFIIWSDYGNPGDPDFESQVTMGLVTN